MLEKARKHRFWGFVIDLVERYSEDGVARSAAAVAYHLFFTLFPMLLLASSLLSMFNLDLHALMERWHMMIPAEVVSIAKEYLDYLGGQRSGGMAWTGFFLTLMGLSASLNCLLHAVSRAYRVENVKRPVYVIAVIFSFFMLLSFYLLLILSVVGQQVILLLESWIPWLPQQVSDLMELFRFAILPGYLLIMLTLFYHILQGRRRQKLGHSLPGALLAVGGIFLATLAFSYYVSNFARYSLLYGSIGTVMVLLLWLYMISLVLILGGEVNHLILQRRRDRSWAEWSTRGAE